MEVVEKSKVPRASTKTGNSVSDRARRKHRAISGPILMISGSTVTVRLRERVRGCRHHHGRNVGVLHACLQSQWHPLTKPNLTLKEMGHRSPTNERGWAWLHPQCARKFYSNTRTEYGRDLWNRLEGAVKGTFVWSRISAATFWGHHCDHSSTPAIWARRRRTP